MKFKYFLRGLGVGIVFSSILLLSAYQENMSNNKLTDAEIIQKAKALGMVEVDSKIGNLLSEQIVSTENNMDSNREKATETSGDSNEQDLQEEDTTTEEDTQSQEDTSEQDTVDNTTNQEIVEITIERGDSSYPICQRLQALGVISNAAEFDTFMVLNGYADRIRVGTHKLTKGMSFQEIAEAISDPV